MRKHRVGARVYVVLSQAGYDEADAMGAPFPPGYCYGKVVAYTEGARFPYTVAIEGMDPGTKRGGKGRLQGNLFTYGEDELR